MTDQVVAYVRVTKDYGAFRVLEGNRSIEKSRVKKIHDSIVNNGYIHSPIIVNEKMEIIDGQGRFEALKKLELPIEYMVFDGLTINDCIVLNVYHTDWSVMDYIESHADRGNMNYKFLMHLLSKYKDLGLTVVINAITGTSGNNGRIMRSIKNGEFQCGGEQYERADELLGYVMRFLKTIKNYPKGPMPYICLAIMFAYQLEDVDSNKLADKFELYYGMADVPQFIDVDGALKNLTLIYNRRNRTDKVYFEIEYDKYLSGKYAWYANKWGNKK